MDWVSAASRWDSQTSSRWIKDLRCEQVVMIQKLDGYLIQYEKEDDQAAALMENIRVKHSGF